MREMIQAWMQRLGLERVRASRRAVWLAGGLGVLTLVGMGGLLVSVFHTPVPVRAPGSPSTAEPLAELSQAAGDSDVWRTNDQHRRRWQVAKMAALSRLVSQFPSIRTATVLLESGVPARLGKAPVTARASVHVVLRPGCAMDCALLRAIVNQIVGSVTGLSPQAVHVIDSAGESYTLAEAQRLPANPQRRKQAEAHWRERIRSVVGPLPGLILAVRIQPDGDDSRCLGAVVSLPRCYAESLYRCDGASGSEPSRAVLTTIMAEESRRIRDVIASLTGAQAGDVHVDWRPEFVVEADAATAVWPIAVLAGSGFVLAGLIALGTVRRIRRRRRRLAWSRVRAMARRRARRTGAPDSATLLSALPAGDVAKILSHLSPARAAKVLARLSGEKQVNVVRELETGPMAWSAAGAEEHIA